MGTIQTNREFFTEYEVEVFENEVFPITDIEDISDDTLEFSDSVSITCFYTGIVYTYDGTDPEPPHGGHLLAPNKSIVINGSENIKNFRAISLYDNEVDDEFSFLTFSFSSNKYNDGGIINVRRPVFGASEPVVGDIRSGYPGIWTGNPTLTYQWQRSLDGEIWEDIVGATSIDYLVQPRDYGHYLRFSETANGWNKKYSEPSALTEIYYGRAEITTTGTNYVFDWYVYISDDISINWGDETSNNYTTANDGYISHTYATAGTYTIIISDMKRISEFYVYSHSGLTIDGIFASSMINSAYTEFDGINVQWEVGENTPIPSGWVEFYFTELDGFIWNVNEYPIPSTLPYFYLNNIPNFIMNVTNSSEQFPSGSYGMVIRACDNFCWNVTPSNKVPDNWTGLGFYQLPNLKWNLNDVPPPDALTYLLLGYIENSYWNLNDENPVPESILDMYLYGDWFEWNVDEYNPDVPFRQFELSDNPNVIWTVNSGNNLKTSLQLIRLTKTPNIVFESDFSFGNNLRYGCYIRECDYSQEKVDLILERLYDGFPNRVYSGATFDLRGNTPPSGTYQAANPPTTGLQYAYELVNDSAGVSTKHWSAIYYSSAPTFTGDPLIDVEYTATAGTWSGSPTLTYQWQKSLDGETGWDNISGATSISYTPTHADYEYYLRLIEYTSTGYYGISLPTDNPVKEQE